MLQYVDVSSCDMEKGHLRCDANVSVRLQGAEKFGTKAEVKNLNSFRFLKMALDHEIERQVGLIESGGRVMQETRLFNVETGETVRMRSKEHAHDYRYFPEPDLVPLRVSEAWLARIRGEMPELPAARRARFIEAYGLREYDAQVLTATRAMSDYFEKVAAASGDAARGRELGDGRSRRLCLKEQSKEIAESPVSAENLGRLDRTDRAGKNQRQTGQRNFPENVRPAIPRKRSCEREGLRRSATRARSRRSSTK